MILISFLEQRLQGEIGMFQAQLVREDITRLQKLEALAAESDTLEDFLKAGLYIGWTKGDFRTHELKEPLTVLLEEIYAGEREPDHDPSKLAALWQAFEAVRMEKLVGCL